MANTSTDQDQEQVVPVSRAAVSGVFWLMLNQLLSRGFVTIALLAIGAVAGPAVLAPMAFIAMFLALSSTMFEDLFVYQLVRSKPRSRDMQFRAAKTYAVCLAAILSALAYPLTPLLARMAMLPELEAQLRWCLLAVWAQALQVPMLAWLRLEMKFRQQSLLAIPGLLLVLALALASLSFYGPATALLVLAVGSVCVQTLIYYLFLALPFRGWHLDRRILQRFLRFGGRLYLANLINIGFAGLYIVVISRAFAPEALGQYFFADRTRELLVLPFMGALQTVVYSALNRADRNPNRLRRAFGLASSVIAIVVVPVCLLVAGFAGEIFELALTGSWEPAASYLALMALATMFVPLHVMNLTVNKVLGRSDWLLRIEIGKKLLAVAVLIVSVRWGVLGIVAGQLIMSIASIFINGAYASRGIGIGIGRQMLSYLPYLAIGVIAVATGRLLAIVTDPGDWLRSCLGMTLALGVYLALNKLLNTQGYRQVKRLIHHDRG